MLTSRCPWGEGKVPGTIYVDGKLACGDWRPWNASAQSRAVLKHRAQVGKGGYASSFSPVPPGQSAAAAAHSKIAGLQRGTRLTAPASWSAARERRFARGYLGALPTGSPVDRASCLVVCQG